MKLGQASMILQLHFPSAQSLTTQLKHDLSLKHVRTHAGLEYATLETIVAHGVAGRVRVWPRPRPRPRPRGVCCGSGWVHHQNHLARHGNTSEGE